MRGKFGSLHYLHLHLYLSPHPTPLQNSQIPRVFSLLGCVCEECFHQKGLETNLWMSDCSVISHKKQIRLFSLII